MFSKLCSYRENKECNRSMLCSKNALVHSVFPANQVIRKLLPFPQASGISGNGPESIRAAISALNLKNTKVDLSNGYIDAQKSTNNGVVVVVVGQLSFPNGGVGKPFVQSFLLSNQVHICYAVFIVHCWSATSTERAPVTEC